MKNHSIKRSALSIMLFISLGLIPVSLAYQTDHKALSNPISAGHNTSAVHEQFPSPTPLLPGKKQTYAKKVSVINHNSVPCYIRVSVNYSDSDVGQAVTLTDLNTTDWVFLSSKQDSKLGGYYYYKHPIKPGAATAALFTSLTVAAGGDFSNLTSEDTFDVMIYEESVQQGSHRSYADAWKTWIRE